MASSTRVHGVTALPKSLERLADSIALPWRDAGAGERKPVKVEPHKCRRTVRKTKIRGEFVTVEWRH